VCKPPEKLPDISQFFTYLNERIPVSTPRNSDQREQLYNDGRIGEINEISTSADQITRLRAIMIDIDLKLLKGPADSDQWPSPRAAYEELIKPMLQRHPVLRNAEVRDSGHGLHVLINFEQSIELKTSADRDRWASIVEIIQRLLPSDPLAPGLGAHTRPAGSNNTKDGDSRPVTQLEAGTPVSARDVEEMAFQCAAAPFMTMASILVGEGPGCPICNQSGRLLRRSTNHGQCYGGCGRVTLEQLLSLFTKA
jgi:hypothetical protein